MKINELITADDLKSVLVNHLVSKAYNNTPSYRKDSWDVPRAQYNNPNPSNGNDNNNSSEKFVTKKELETQLNMSEKMLDMRLNLFERRMTFVEDMMKGLGD